MFLTIITSVGLLILLSHHKDTKELNSSGIIEIQDGFDYNSITETEPTNLSMVTERILPDDNNVQNVSVQSREQTFKAYCKKYMEETRLTYSIIPGKYSLLTDNHVICITTQLTVV